MPLNRERLFQITLSEFEKVVRYGVARQTWSIYFEDRWVAARLVPGAIVNSLPSKPGLVWERSIEVSLAAGTRLELVSEMPKPRRQLDAFNILTLDQGSATLARKTLHRVTDKGRLTRIDR